MNTLKNVAMIVVAILITVVACSIAYGFCVMIAIDNGTTPMTNMLQRYHVSNGYNTAMHDSARALSTFNFHDVLNTVTLF